MKSAQKTVGFAIAALLCLSPLARAETGFVVFAPVRRGHGASEGEYIVNRIKLTARLRGRGAAAHLTSELLATEQFRDQLSVTVARQL